MFVRCCGVYWRCHNAVQWWRSVCGVRSVRSIEKSSHARTVFASQHFSKYFSNDPSLPNAAETVSNDTSKSERKPRKTGLWSQDEDELLLEAIRQPGRPTWPTIARHVGTRTAMQCCSHWKYTLKPLLDGVNTGAWSPDEDALLTEAVQRHSSPSIDWHRVVHHMGGVRSELQCCQRWYRVLLPQREGRHQNKEWTPEEDAALMEAVSLYKGQGHCGGIPWQKVVRHMGFSRTVEQCCDRWKHVLLPRHDWMLNSGIWTEVENVLLQEAVQLYEGKGKRGEMSWSSVARHVKTRTASQCRARWKFVLNGQENNVPWSAEEDTALREGVHRYIGKGQHGTINWTKVAQYMQHRRSAKQCQQRWRRCLEPEAKRIVGKWSKEEDAKLLQAVNEKRTSSGIDWVSVAETFDNTRTHAQCRARYDRGLRPAQEGKNKDECLKRGVSMYRDMGLQGTVNWVKVSEFMKGSRLPDQCRVRWRRISSNENSSD